MVKSKIFSLGTGYSCTTLRVKNSLEIALSCTIFEILTLFHFPLKSKMAAKSGENLNCFPWHSILLYYPAGQKFTHRSISCKRFSKYSLLHFPPKVSKIEIFPLGTGYSCTTLWVKNSLKIALSLTVFEVFTLFYFPQKSKMAAKSGEN